MPDHDHGYKLLFAEPRLVEDLLRGFVAGEWVDRLDYTTLERVNTSFVSEELQGREDDVIWKVRFRDSGWLYVYLLLEFQSSVDVHMALRIMVYVGLLYQDLLAQQVVPSGQRLPPVLPVVLYNGARPWRAVPDVADLIEPVAGFLAPPRCSYLLVDEVRSALPELSEQRNLVAALFQLERSRSAEDIRRVVEHLVAWLDAPGQERLRRVFSVWLRRVLIPARVGSAVIPECNNLGEVRMMLAERVIEWTQEWKAEGRVEERRRQLLRLLPLRFGPLSAELQARIEQEPDGDRVDRWLERLLLAPTLAEVFEEH